MRQQGEIIKIENGQAWVKFANPGTACGNCKGCIRLSMRELNEPKVLQVKLTIAANVGDKILIEYPSKNLFQAMLLLYGLPFLGLFLGYFLAFYYTKNDATSALTAVVGLVLSAIIARIIVRRIDSKLAQPQIVSKVCQQS